MKFCVIMGSMRLNRNTAELCKPFLDELEKNCAGYEYITLANKKILPCIGCYHCQNIQDEYGCVQKDDVEDIMHKVIESDVVVLATPIYTWYCTTPMKSLLDRHYGLNKYYGTAQGSLWKGKKIAIIATHGYDVEYGASTFRDGIKRLCEHSNLEYCGMYSVRDIDDIVSFQTKEAISGARDFAKKLMAI